MSATRKRVARFSVWLRDAAVRPAILGGWCLVAWGTLLDLALLASSVEHGPAEAVRLLATGETAWSYLNAAAAVLAPCGWLVAWLLARGLRSI